MRIKSTLRCVNICYLVALAACVFMQGSADEFIQKVMEYAPHLIQVMVLNYSIISINTSFYKLIDSSPIQVFKPNKILSYVGLIALANLLISIFAQVITMPARGFTLIEGDPQNLEHFYETWTVPVRAWTASYLVQLLYALMMVYTLMKACLAEEAHPELFDKMLPPRSQKEESIL